MKSRLQTNSKCPALLFYSFLLTVVRCDVLFCCYSVFRCARALLEGAPSSFMEGVSVRRVEPVVR